MIYWVLVLCTGCHTLFAFTLKPGDLLFSEELCGEFCDAIDQATQTRPGIRITHIGMAVNDHQVIEAIQSGVTLTPLSDFLARAQPIHQQPTVWIGRIKPAYTTLIPSAIQFAQRQIGKPYNASFIDYSEHSFYCSQLITESFYQANHHQAIFPSIPMNFKNLHTHTMIPAWQRYFNQRHELVPQGMPGSSPMQLFEDPKITIMHRYFRPSTVTHTLAR